MPSASAAQWRVVISCPWRRQSFAITATVEDLGDAALRQRARGQRKLSDEAS